MSSSLSCYFFIQVLQVPKAMIMKMTHPQAPRWTQLQVQGWRQQKEKKWDALLNLQHFGGKEARWSSEMGLKILTSISITHTDLHKLNNKLVSA